MRNKLHLSSIPELNGVKTGKAPIVVGISIVYMTTLVQNIKDLSLRSIIWFTIAMALHMLLYLFSDKLFKHRHWIYFLVQGVIVFDCAIIIPKGYETVFLGLIPVLIFQSMIIYDRAIKVIIIAVFYYSLFCSTIIIFDGVEELIKYIPIFALITIAIRSYSALYLRQVKLRIQSQKTLRELEFAYEKVEELTLTNERQRMARDLHDTLSQGIAGLIMQLEAIHTNIKSSNTKRAQEIVEKSMGHARKTLSEARLVIDDLRFYEKEEPDILPLVEKEVADFKHICETSVTTDVRIQSQISSKIYKHILYIIREGLNNIAKHAKAKHAIVEVIETKNQVNINIIDDGIGFNIKLLDQLYGHYGILGITERVKAINGEIKIKSKKKSGTRINIIIPIKKGTYGEDE